jgi:hypothetical protein
MTGPRPLHDALWHYACGFDALALLGRFQAAGQQPEPGIIRNFLGTRIEPLIHPAVLAPAAGTVEGLPLPGNWHADIAEWAAALLTVERAQGTYRIVELGCGWGCWMTNMGVAARARGLKVDLIGIEAEAQHLAAAHRTLALNGFGAGDYALTHGVAGPTPGHAIFPRAAPGQAGWGGAAVLDPAPADLAAARGRADLQVLDRVTLGQLSAGRPIDLLHIDIQGAEVDFVTGNLAQMKAHVRHVLIGTHSRVIEGALIGCLGAAGWTIEMERPAVMPFRNGAPSLEIDGVQLWKGPMAG